MTERCFDGALTQQGEATYDNYRKFSVDTRESLGSDSLTDLSAVVTVVATPPLDAPSY